MKKTISIMLMLFAVVIGYAAGKDDQGNDISLNTQLNAIETSQTTINDIADLTKTTLTNSTFAGYGWPFGEWSYTPTTLGLTLPVYTNNLWRFTETNLAGEVVGSACWIEQPEEAIQLTYTLNSTNITFTRVGTEIYTNNLGFVTYSNLTQYVKHTQLDKRLKGYVSNETLEKYDASYRITDGISDENQTIQLVVDSSDNPQPLEIVIPSSGRCKDWIVHITSKSNMVLRLPPAYYWVRNESVTNDIAAGTPTSLYFSQVSSSDNIFTLSRQEYNIIEVTSGQGQLLSTMIKTLSKKNNKLSAPRVIKK